MFGIFESLVGTVEEFIDDPIGKSVDVATQPVIDVLDIVDGLSEGELREKAIIRLGTDVAMGMTLSELIDSYADTMK